MTPFCAKLRHDWLVNFYPLRAIRIKIKKIAGKGYRQDG